MLKPTDAVALLALLTRTALRIAAPPIHLAGVTEADTGVPTTAPPGAAFVAGKMPATANSRMLNGVTFAWNDVHNALQNASNPDAENPGFSTSTVSSQGKGLSGLLARYIPYISGQTQIPNFTKLPRLARAPLFLPATSPASGAKPSENTSFRNSSQSSQHAVTAIAAAPAILASLSMRSLLHLLYGLVLRAIMTHHQVQAPANGHSSGHRGGGDAQNMSSRLGSRNGVLSSTTYSGHITVTPQSLSNVTVPLPIVWLLLMLLDATVCSAAAKRQQLQRLAQENERQAMNLQTSEALLATTKATCGVLETQLQEHNRALRVARVELARAKRVAELNVMARKVAQNTNQGNGATQ